MDKVIAIDPGREKCGIAVADGERGVLSKEVIAAADLLDAVEQLLAEYGAKTIVIGDGTASGASIRKLEEKFADRTVNIVCVDEYRTTEMAKIRYWQENPPRGWRKLLPVSMQVPPVPVDDYVAVILAERYLKK